jgi:Fe-Mn family superoxide dismutase
MVGIYRSEGESAHRAERPRPYARHNAVNRRLASMLHHSMYDPDSRGRHFYKEKIAMHTLTELPFELDSLEPWISRETLDYHYGKHHRGYVNALNELVRGTQFEPLSLEETVRAAARSGAEAKPVYNNAAQAWNHAFYWRCLTPRDTTPGAATSDALNRRFGSVEGFRHQFTNAAVRTFGSGWTWLVADRNGELDILSTSNADTPLTGDRMPLLTCDVWEHAYYIDYRNARAEYLTAFWKIVDWRFVESNFNKHLGIASDAA